MEEHTKEEHSDSDSHEVSREESSEETVSVVESSEKVSIDVPQPIEKESVEMEEESSEHVEKKHVEHEVKHVEKKEEHVHHEKKHHESRKSFGEGILHFFDKNYKVLMIIPFLLLFVGLVLVGGKIVTDGTFVEKDVSLKGGVTVTVTPKQTVDASALEQLLLSQYVGNDISIRTLRGQGVTSLAISSDIDGTENDAVDAFLAAISAGIGEELTDNYSVEIIGSSLGASFFKETLTALFIAFILMSLIVFIYFRSFVPSIAVILAAFSDIVVTLAIVNVMGMKLGAGGIAAFLMLIGYSVDTDMLLTTRMIKRREGSAFERAIGAFKTGMMMNFTTMAGIVAALFFVQSETIRQILTIVLIGLLVDIVFTWIQNVGILRWHLDRKVKH
jgi:preprotein translocase subunit SecF